MSALTKSRMNKALGASGMDFPVAANVKGYKGGLAVASGGYVKPGVAASSLFVVGVFSEDFDNTGGSAGDISVHVDFGKERRFVRMIGDPSNLFAATDLFGTAYILDDQTVTTDSTTKTAMPGKVFRIESKNDVQLVHVEIV